MKKVCSTKLTLRKETIINLMAIKGGGELSLDVCYIEIDQEADELRTLADRCKSAGTMVRTRKTICGC